MLLQKFAAILTVTVLYTASLASPTAETREVDERSVNIKPGFNSALDARQVGTICGPVTGANVTGICQNANNTCCNGFYSVGFCPGAANIRCCTSLQRCRGGNGFCNDLSHVSCSQPYIAGLCPGNNNVRCCRGFNGETCTPGGP